MQELIDFKLEFGKFKNSNNEVMIILADEISPDNCRLLDIKTKRKLIKIFLEKTLEIYFWLQ